MWHMLKTTSALSRRRFLKTTAAAQRRRAGLFNVPCLDSRGSAGSGEIHAVTT